jgi:hypothetical protein
MARNMDELLSPVNPGNKESNHPTPEYQQWHARIKQLLMEAEYAREKGEWKKAEDLIIEASNTTRDFCDKNLSQ